MSLPVRPPSPPAQPAPPPPAPPATPNAPAVGRNTIGEVKRSGVILPPAPSATGEIEVNSSTAPAPESLGASKPNAPAPTVMFESQIHQRPPTMEEQGFGAPASLPVQNAPLPEPEPPPEPSPPPAVSKHKGKGKPPRKIYKPKSSLTKREDEESTAAKSTSSKTGIIIFFILLAIGILIVTVVILRGGKSKQVPPSTETSTEKSKALFEPSTDEPTFVPKKPPPSPEPVKPARPAKPAPAAERPKPAPRPEPAPTETSKPSDDDIRRANEAYQRGNAKLFAGNTSEAITEFSLALKLNPRDPVNHRALGLAHEKAGHTREATKHLRAYLKAAPKANDRAMVEKHLNQLRRR